MFQEWLASWLEGHNTLWETLGISFGLVGPFGIDLCITHRDGDDPNTSRPSTSQIDLLSIHFALHLQAHEYSSSDIHKCAGPLMSCTTWLHA